MENSSLISLILFFRFFVVLNIFGSIRSFCGKHSLRRTNTHTTTTVVWNKKFNDRRNILLATKKDPLDNRLKRISENKPQRVVVIGGGPAGYFAAIECARMLNSRHDGKNAGRKNEVIILEAGPNPLAKVIISGGGRCNVMHDPKPLKNDDDSPSTMTMREFLHNAYPRGERELFSLYSSVFGPIETEQWFEERGLDLKTERDGRVFPTTDKSESVVQTLEEALHKEKIISLHCGMKVEKVEFKDSENSDEKVFSVCYTRNNRNRATTDIESPSDNSAKEEEETDIIECDRVIVATGSSRIGHGIARSLGHTIVPPTPSLFSFKTDNYPTFTALSGTTAPLCRIQWMSPGGDKTFSLSPFTKHCSAKSLKTSLTQRGPLLITQQGISGPVVLKLSAFGAEIFASLKYRLSFQINWLGELTAEQVYTLLEHEKDQYPRRTIGKCFPRIPKNLFSPPSASHSIVSSSCSPLPIDAYRFGGNSDIIDSLLRSNGNSEEYIDGSTLITRRLWLYLLREAFAEKDGKEGEREKSTGSVRSDKDSFIGKSKEDGSDDDLMEKLQWAQVSKSRLRAIAQKVTGFILHTNGRNPYKDEFVTCGGVPLNEIDMKTMSTSPSLHGEILNIDGITGGYNFQSAWSTGYLAGRACADSIITE